MTRRRVHEEQGQGDANGVSEKVVVERVMTMREAESPRHISVAALQSAPTPETVSVTWGEELFTPVQFCSFRVGPFSASSALRDGETREQAADRLMRELEKVAAKERETKARVFKQALTGITGKGA